MLDEEIKYTILFVDDEESNLSVFKTTFKWYYNVFVAISAHEGMKILEKEKIDMIITDQRMPKVTGVEFLKKVIPKYPDLVRILLTAYSDVEAIAYAINEAGIYQYIQKPWDADEMRHILQKAFISYQLHLDNVKLISDLEKANKSLKEANEHLEAKVLARTAEVMAKTAEVLSQKSELELKNSKITSSINYAKRIQDAMLPRVPAMQRAFGEFFVLFKPRDIVSGDFYWFFEHKHIKIVAAVDCTGHGVPGAFMSLVGQQALNRIVGQNKIVQPELILNELHKEIRILLKQDQNGNRDGMDMAICLYNKKTNEVSYSGAKNPLIYIRDNELHQIKGDKHPIGGKQKEDERLFTHHTIKCEAPTMFYIFTDGYQDQFGGEEGRKFMISRMRGLLQDIHDKPMIVQKDVLENTIEDWKKDTKQLDDILVMGFKID